MAFEFHINPLTGLATIPNVELATTGEWDASTGTATFTENDMVSAVSAVEDPAVKEPRLIVGHTPPDAGPTMSGQDGFFGEQPVLGRFTNLRLADNNQTIMADLVGVPEWLAKIMPTAYPSRSIEGYWNVETATGKKHEFVIPRVAILGVSLPAVETLEDLQAVFSEDGPDGIQLTHVGERVAASRGGAMPQRVTASVQVEDVRRAFYEDFATDDRYWWWIRAVFMSPSKLIVDDDEGGLYAVPYTVSGDGVTFKDPVEIFTQYVEKDSGKVAAAAVDAAAAIAVQGQDVLAKFTSAVDSRPSDRRKGAKMGLNIERLRQLHGLTAEQLPDDASEDQVNEVLENLPVPGTSPDPAGTEPTGTEPEPGTVESGTPAPGEPTEGGADRGSEGPGEGSETQASGVTLDRGTYDELQRQAREGAAARAQQNRERQASAVDAAIKAGKIPPVRRDHYITLMGRDEQGTTEFLNSLEAGAVPVGEHGQAGDGEVAAAQEYIDSHLTADERRRIAAARAGEPLTTRIVSEA